MLQGVIQPSLPSEPRVICVLGMHRSGTSAVTRCLNLLGVHLGPADHLMKPAEANNPTGFWEIQSLSKLNEEILKTLGGTWSSPPELTENWQKSPSLDRLRERARALITEEYGAAPLWAWKDPRTSLTLPFWQEILPPMRYVICLRNPVDVALSLQQRNELSLEAGLNLWLHYTQSSLHHSAGHPRTMVFYGDLMRNPLPEMERLAEFAGVLERAQDADVRAEFLRFLRQDLQHHQTSLADTMSNPHLSFPTQALQLILRLYVDLLRVKPQTQEDEDALVQAAIDRLSFQARQASLETDGLRGRVGELSRDLAQTRQSLQTRTAEAAQHEQSAKVAAVERDVLRHERTRLARDLIQVQQIVSGQEATLLRQQQEGLALARQWAEWTQTNREQLAARDAALHELRTELEQARAAQARIEAELRQELAGRKQAVAALSDGIEKLKAQVAAHDATLQDQSATLARRQKQIEEADREQKRTAQKMAQLQASLIAHKRAVDYLRGSRTWKAAERIERLTRWTRNGSRNGTTAWPSTLPLHGKVEFLRLVLQEDVFRGKLSGWCAGGDGVLLPEIRLFLDDRLIGVGYPSQLRPDISTALGLPEYATTGFEFLSSRTVPEPFKGRLKVVCEWRGQRLTLHEAAAAEVPRDERLTHDLRHGIDRFELSDRPSFAHPILRISGWVLAMGQKECAEVEVRFDGASKLRVEADIGRDDVEKAHRRLLSRWPSSAPNCGFHLSVAADRAVKQVQLVVHTRFGEKVLIEKPMTKLPVKDRAIAPVARSRSGIELATKVFLTRNGLAPWKWGECLQQFREQRARQQMAADSPPAAHTAAAEAYQVYVQNNQISPEWKERLAAVAREFAYQPVISILMPVYDVDPKWLQVAVESVRDQIYPSWELCIADDASTRADLIEFLEHLPADPRVKRVRRPSNGHISAASNSAAELATGEFVALMDNDDALEPHALFEIVRLLQQHRDADIVYSDEDKIDADGRRYDPQFKPDWSPEMLLAYNYFNHLTCIRRSLFQQVGGFRIGFEGSQDHDLLLRLVTVTDRVHHIPKVLYHWRALPTSTASNARVKPIMHEAGRKGLEEHLQRLAVPARLYTPEFAKRLGVPIRLLDWPDDGPSVAILIPTKNKVKLLRRCLESLLQKTTYRNFRVVVIDNESDDPETLAYLGSVKGKGVSVEPVASENGRFSFSRLNNVVAGRAGEDLVLFLNNDTEVIEPKWLSRMVGYLGLPGVGATGARLLFADGRLQHAGVILGLKHGIAPGHGFFGQRAEQVSYYFQAEIARPCSAVTGACLLTRRELFLAMGGFDETNFPVSLNDVDYCLRLGEKGLRSVYVGSAELLHHESKSRGRRDDPGELTRFRAKYPSGADRYYNPNLSDSHSYQIDNRCHLDYAEYLPAPVRVLLCTHNLNPEGAPRSLFELASGLHRRGRVEPVVHSPVDGPGRDWYRAAGLDARVCPPVVPLPSHNVPQSEEAFEAIVRQTQEQIQQAGAEVVIANTLNHFAVVHAAARLGVPAIWIIRESYDEERMRSELGRVALAACEAAFPLAYRVVFVSGETRRHFMRYDTRHNFEIIPNGLDARRIDEYRARVTPAEAREAIGAPSNKKIIVTIGTICERKDQHTLALAASLLRDGRDDFCCYLVGLRRSLPYAACIEQIVREHQLEKIVRLVPETNDVFPYYRAGDVFVFTSHLEAFSRTILEAEAFGLPIVTTPCCGVREQVRDEVNARFFGMSDAKGLAQHLSSLLDSEPDRIRMGIHSRHVFDYLVGYEEMLLRYERLVLGGRIRGPLPTVSANAPT